MRSAALSLSGVVLLVLLAGCGGGGGGGGGDPVSASDARACLAMEKLRVLGGPRAPDDTDAPDTELVVSGSQASAFLGFYRDEQRARRAAPPIKKNVKAFRGALERHDKLTILWVRGKESAEADKIKRCVL